MSNNQKILEELLFTLIFVFLFLSSSLMMVGLYLGVAGRSSEVVGSNSKADVLLNESVNGDAEVIGKMDTDPVIEYPVVIKFDDQGNIADCPVCTMKNTDSLIDRQRGYTQKFSENSYIDLTNAVDLSSKDKFTLKFLIKPDFDETSEDWKYIFSDNGSIQLFYFSNLNDLRLFLRTDKGVYRADTKGLKWKPDNWYELKVVYDGSHAKIFWDGEEVAEGPARGKISSTEGKVLVGASQNYEMGFTGSISQVEISDKVLSD
jgi:hypothetical protein